ncbi:hypothetical protein C8J56DRAFT_1130108 [Mycena floridula]|nr:hypothetical protein C8J56DRAFT_1130108 [Mycena floridula]
MFSNGKRILYRRRLLERSGSKVKLESQILARKPSVTETTFLPIRDQNLELELLLLHLTMGTGKPDPICLMDKRRFQRASANLRPPMERGMFVYECKRASSRHSREVGLVTDRPTGDISVVPVVATQKDIGPCCPLFSTTRQPYRVCESWLADVAREPTPETKNSHRGLRRSNHPTYLRYEPTTVSRKDSSKHGKEKL